MTGGRGDACFEGEIKNNCYVVSTHDFESFGVAPLVETL